MTDAEIEDAYNNWLDQACFSKFERLRYVLESFSANRIAATSTKPAPPLQDAKEAAKAWVLEFGAVSLPLGHP